VKRSGKAKGAIPPSPPEDKCSASAGHLSFCGAKTLEGLDSKKKLACGSVLQTQTQSALGKYLLLEQK
jgi:hypothetical protein